MARKSKEKVTVALYNMVVKSDIQRRSVLMTIGIFPALFYTFLLALCSARCTIEKRDAVGRIRVRRLRWRIEELARLLSPTSISVEQTNNQSEDTKMQLPALSTFLVMQTMTQIEIKLSEA